MRIEHSLCRPRSRRRFVLAVKVAVDHGDLDRAREARLGKSAYARMLGAPFRLPQLPLRQLVGER
jgi:hypothetical protein